MIATPNFFKSRTHRLALSLLVPAFAVALLGLSASAHASSIIVDGGFESAGGGNVYFAGDSIDGGSWNVTLGAIYIDTQDPYVFASTNSVNLTFANDYVPNSLSQTLSTIVGQNYAVSFWADADTPNTFGVTQNGVAISGIPSSIAQNGFPGNTNSSLFTEYVAGFKASSTTTDLEFTSVGNPPIGSQFGSVMIDNVSVQPVPEPGTIILTLSGMIGLVIERKRQIKAALSR